MRFNKQDIEDMITTLQKLTGEDREDCWWEIYDMVIICEGRKEREEWKRLREDYEGECFR